MGEMDNGNMTSIKISLKLNLLKLVLSQSSAKAKLFFCGGMLISSFYTNNDIILNIRLEASIFAGLKKWPF